VRLGLLVPRYGEEVVGGTEHWLRELCEHLVADRDWSVEVFTTCAKSAATWADEYPPATTVEAGVTVHRYRSVSGRNAEYLHQLPRLQRDPTAFTEAEAAEYVRLVGPVCPDATAAAGTAVQDGRCELIAVTPYLYWPTVTAVPRLRGRVIFHGAAHDEPELYLPLMRPVFESVGGFAFNSFSERALVERNFGVGHLPSSVIGNAVDEGSGDPAAARQALGLERHEPFVLCVGRVERAKGATALAAMWDLYVERSRARAAGAPRLVLLGPEHEPIHAGPEVLRAGRQPEAVKWGALAACDLLVAPSAQESFSLVVLEAWLAGRPVVVNGRCGPTVEHCRRSGGGIWFDGYGDFEAGIDRLRSDPALRDELAAGGAAYTRDAFAWPRILDRYEALADRILARAGPN
jgi:glycosyltransferase involved in cell wall biosynthesis